MAMVEMKDGKKKDKSYKKQERKGGKCRGEHKTFHRVNTQ